MTTLRTNLLNITRAFIDNIFEVVSSTPIVTIMGRRSVDTTEPAVFAGPQSGILTAENGKYVVRTSTRTYVSTRRRDALRRARERGIEVLLG